MATVNSIFVPEANPTIVTVTNNSNVNTTFAKNRILAIMPRDGTCFVAFGNSASGSFGSFAATANSWQIASGSIQEFDLGDAWDTVGIFNNSGATIHVQILPITKS